MSACSSEPQYVGYIKALSVTWYSVIPYYVLHITNSFVTVKEQWEYLSDLSEYNYESSFHLQAGPSQRRSPAL